MEEEFEEFEEDFDLTNAKYQVWLLGENKDQLATDFEYLVGEFDDSEKAENAAIDFYDDPAELLKKITLPEDTKIIIVQVETVVDLDGWEENVETIYRRKIEIF